ncbi:MAG: hypothetical protein HFE65_08370 [Clostridiales bacterium]|nr:hypothetical protein [Clostridiales bacterium]
MNDIIHLNDFYYIPSFNELSCEEIIETCCCDNELINSNGEHYFKPYSKDCKILYCVFPFYIEDTCNRMISIGTSSKFICYLNEKLLYCNETLCACTVLDNIRSGQNYIILQLPNEGACFRYSIRLTPYYEDDLTPGSPALNYYIQKTLYIREQEDKQCYKFQLGNRNFIDRNNEAYLQISDMVNTPIYRGTIELNKWYVISKNKLNTDKIYKLEFLYQNNKNKKQELSTFIVFLSERSKQTLAEIRITLEKLLNSQEIFIREEARLRLYALQHSSQTALFWEIQLALVFVNYIENNNIDMLIKKEHVISIIKKIPDRCLKVYYTSSCCLTPGYFYLTYPLSLTEETPVVFDLTYGVEDTYCTPERKYDDENILHVFAPQIGHLLGNCMGEVNFLDIYKYIEKYIIRRHFIAFLIGYSNGAHAAWSLAEKYPDLIAGIYVVSGSVNTDYIKNIRNVFIRNVSSIEDELFSDCYKKPGELLSSHEQYHSMLVENANHTDLFYMLYQRDYLSELLQSKKVEEPKEFEFFTQSNQFLTAYWIQLFPLQKNSSEAKIIISTDDKVINITVYGVQGFRINWPSYLYETVSIKINHQQTIMVIRDSDFIDFIFNPIKCEYELIYILPDWYNRCSIADVFRRRVQIFICDNKLSFLSDRLSNPKTFFLDAQTNIEYSVVDNIQGFNLKDNRIIVGHIMNNNIQSYCEQSKIPIKFFQNGFLYNNQTYLGSYNVICTFESDNVQIVLIITNDYSCIKNNIYLRLLLIPSFENEFVSFINNQVLIMLNDKYYSIYEWGNNIIDEFNHSFN